MTEDNSKSNLLEEVTNPSFEVVTETIEEAVAEATGTEMTEVQDGTSGTEEDLEEILAIDPEDASTAKKKDIWSETAHNVRFI